MTVRMFGAKHLLQLLTPPALWRVGKKFRRRFDSSVDHLAYAPEGWATPLPAEHTEAFWKRFVGQERAAFEELIARVQSGEAVVSPQPEEDFKHIAFGCAAALAAQGRDRISILDYGGNLGDYLWIARELLPAISVDFDCKELALVADVGREVNPSVTWHTDDGCFEASYDLVMFVSSLQCLRDWRSVMQRGAVATRNTLLLSDVPAVRVAPSFVSTQRSRGVTTLYNVLNRAEVVDGVERLGLRLIREFDMGPHPPVANAPEQPRCVGLLFRR
jgi:putative methyltransferase (TIGR04325 family)